MENIFDMIKRVDFLNDVRESKRMAAAEVLQKEMCAFVAHYGQVSTDECQSTWHLYVLLRNGNVLIRKENEDEEVEIEGKNLSIEEMKFLHEFMKETLYNDIQYQEDEIDRYTNICL